MEKQRLESLLIDYIDEKLNADDRATVDQELRTNPYVRKLYEELKELTTAIDRSPPLVHSEVLRTRFEKTLQAEIEANARQKTIIFTPVFYRAAAVIALMIISGFIGFWISSNNSEHQARIAEIEKEMEQTRQQLADTRRTMFDMLENEQSASQRIKGVNVAMGLSTADDEIITALFTTMLSDPNTNVRLAALEALSRFRNDPGVRTGLIDALSKQSDPMVQINLIQLMVQMKEKQIVDELQRIADDAHVMKAVRDEAYTGILKLS